MSKFIHFRGYSSYSLGESTCSIEKLVKTASKFGMPAIALADKANMFGAMEFSLVAQKQGVQPIHGCALNITYKNPTFAEPEVTGELLFIAQNETGFKNLIKLVTFFQMNVNAETHEKHLDFKEVIKHKEGLFVLCGGVDSLPWQCKNKSESVQIIGELQKNFADNLLIEVIRDSHEQQHNAEEFFVNEAYDKKIPLIATNPVTFIAKEHAEAKDVLHCIVNSHYISETNRKLVDEEHYFKSSEEMKELFKDLPEAYENTEILAQKCHYFAEKRSPLLPKFCKEGEDEKDVLKQTALRGLEDKVIFKDEKQKQTYIERLEYEMSVINRMDYAGYFLIVSDFIKWSKNNDIPVGPGRGSGAGSLVAYCLDITDIDPLEFGLLFERFLNPERISMPDFDIDFCQYRRDEVIDYVSSKYGSDRVAHIITFRTLKARAALRDVGRVLQMSYGHVDSICKMIPNNPSNPVTLRQAIDLDKNLQKMSRENPEVNKLLTISLQLEGLHSHVSTHAAGIVIADRDLTELIPLYKDHSNNTVMIQYSMKYAEEAGLIKFDFLGLKTLTVVSNALKLINKDEEKFSFEDTKFDDLPTYKNLTLGKTLGVFQFESAGMREAIKKIKPDNIDDLIALGALYRPGPMDNIPRYVARKHKQEEPEYPHPLIQEVLEETYGIIVYQEQVIKIAQKLAGYTLGSADILRRAMGKKIKAEMEAQRNIFIKGAVENNVDKSKAEEIFALIEKFASYGFPKPHAAAYAVISYQTAYLKANYPKEFFVALLNLDIDDTDKINLYIQDAKLLNIKTIPPSINSSEADFSIEGDSIVFGLGAIKNSGLQIMREIVNERKQNGKYVCLHDFLQRNSGILNKKILEALIKSGSLDELHANQRQLVENVEIILKYCQTHEREKNSKQMSLFDTNPSQKKMFNLNLPECKPWSILEKTQAEFEAFGFYLKFHPLDRYTAKLNKLGISYSHEIEAKATAGGNKIKIAGVVTNKKIRSSQRGKYCFLQVSDSYGLAELCIFNEQLLYKFNEQLEVGKALLFVADAKKDDSGSRVIIENILKVEEAVAHVIVEYEIIVKTPKVLPYIKNMCSAQGNNFTLKLVTDNDNEISLNVGSNLRIKPESLEDLRELEGVVVNEC